MADGGVGGYLTISGIPGTSNDPKHRSSIEIQSFSFYPPNRRPPSGIGIVKQTDLSSTHLFNAVNNGRSFNTAVLEYWNRGVLDTGPYSSFDVSPSLDFLKITMIGAMITSFNYGHNVDMFIISFEKMQTTAGSIPAPNLTVQPQHRPLFNRMSGRP